MKKIILIFIGKPKYEGIDKIVSVFKKRIVSYIDIKEIFLKEKDFKIDKNIVWLKKEIEKKLNKNNSALIVFSPEGESITSNKFSEDLFTLFENYDCIGFLVGGKTGIPFPIKNNAYKIISFSKMVFGHQIFRIMLFEQIYRAITIKYNMKYN